MKKYSWPVLLGCLMLLGACSFFASDELKLEAAVEAPVLAHYSEVSGKILEYPLQLGQEVEPGTVVARIDSSELEYRLEQTESVLLKQQMQLAEMLSAADPAEIQQARNNILIAEHARDEASRNLSDAQDHYDKVLYLYENGANSEQELDNAARQLDLVQSGLGVTTAQLDNSQQQLRLISSGASDEQIRAVQADIAQTESQIRQMQDQLLKYTIHALGRGRVISRNYELGSMVAAGYDLLDISDAEAQYAYAWLPVRYIHAVNYGMAVTIIDARGQEYAGSLNWIDVQAEYTPKSMQNGSNKNQESVKIRAALDPDCPLKPGETVTLRIVMKDEE